MRFKLTYIKDSFDNNYIGIDITPNIVYPFLNSLKEILGDKKYNEYHKSQQDRDNGHYHITVINVMEYNKLTKDMGIDKFVNSLEAVFNYDFNDVKLMGLGTAEKNGNRAYFVVVDSDDLQEVRKKYGLTNHDFHITIGFLYKDVFGVRKNEVMKIYDPFLKLLKKNYYKSETFDFIRDIENFDYDMDCEIEPIKIENTYANFRCGENNYFTVSLIPDKLRISAKWQDTEKKPILSNTIISRKLKDI